MATSSITKSFVISGKEQVEKFCDALDASRKFPQNKSNISFKELTDSKEIIKLMNQRKNDEKTK